MKAYILCFILSLFFVFLAERSFRKKHKKVGFLWLVCSMLIICLIAGVRSLTVGKDIHSYFSVLYYNFIEMKLDFFTIKQIANVEIGYTLLIYLSSLFKNIYFCLFVTELAVCFPIYIFAYKKRKEYSMLFVIAIFLLTLFCPSLNLMRQSIAISLIVCSVPFFEEKNYKVAFFFYFLAILFHTTAIIGGLIYLLMYCCRMKEKNRRLFVFSILFFSLFFTLFFDKIILFLPNRYSYYFETSYATSSVGLLSIFKKLIWLFFSLFYLWRFKNKKDASYGKFLSYFLFFLMDFIFYFMSLRLSPAGRLGYYFLYSGYFMFLPCIKDMFYQKKLINGLVLIILIGLWFNMTVINRDADHTYPYTSEIMPILNDAY